MSGWLLDTNVLSELKKPNCAAPVRRWIRSQNPRNLFISPITFAEIRFGINRLPDRNRRVALHDWLNNELRPWFVDRILEIDEEVILRWREMVETGRKSGRTFSPPDLFLAATASVHGLSLVTRNTADFAGTDIAILNPWDASI